MFYVAVKQNDTVDDLVIQLIGASPRYHPHLYTIYRPSFRLGPLSGDETMRTLNVADHSVFHARIRVKGGSVAYTQGNKVFSSVIYMH